MASSDGGKGEGRALYHSLSVGVRRRVDQLLEAAASDGTTVSDKSPSPAEPRSTTVHQETTRKRQSKKVTCGPGVFSQVGWGGLPSTSGEATVDGCKYNGGPNSRLQDIEALQLRLHQLEFAVQMGRDREQQWLLENMSLRDQLRDARGGYRPMFVEDANDDKNDLSSSGSTVAATTTLRPQDGDLPLLSNTLAPSPQLLLLQLEAQEGAKRTKVESEASEELWGPGSLWVSFLRDSQRASLIDARASTKRIEELTRDLKAAQDSLLLKTKESCILVDQLRQMQLYHERERKDFRDKLIDMAQAMSTSSSNPPTSGGMSSSAYPL